MEINWLALVVAALIPTVVGFIYYNPKILGTVWMKSLGKTEEELRDGFNMPLTMIVGLVLSFLLAFVLKVIVETGHKTVEAGELVWGSTHTFGHGAFHGLFYGLLIATPILITNGMYERKSWSNMLLNCGYWIITISLMSGLLDAWY